MPEQTDTHECVFCGGEFRQRRDEDHTMCLDCRMAAGEGGRAQLDCFQRMEHPFYRESRIKTGFRMRDQHGDR